MRRPLGPAAAIAGVEGWLSEGARHVAAGRLAEAIAAYERAARADPADFRAPFSLATLALRQGRADRAIVHLRTVVARRPDLFEAWYNLGAAAQTLEAWSEAADAYGRALALRPDAVEARRSHAMVLAVLGRLDEAVAEHLRLAAHGPTRLWALTRAALLRPAAIGAADLAEMRRAAADPAVDADTRAGLGFAAGEVLERLGQDEDAFAAFAAGNRLKRATVDAAAHLAAHQAAARRVAQTFTPAFLEAHRGRGLASAAPIFIVGMPRSGSTLIEQILGRHPQVLALGETAALPPLLEALDHAPGADLRGVGRRYLAAIRARGWRGAGRFVDKTLENYLHVGALAAMFPEAVILHSVREAMDTCLSCYRQLFASGGETLYDLADIGAEYVSYRAVIDHWRKLLPGRLVDVDHEALVEDPERQIRWLVTEACGLEWDAACLSFHEASGPVRTASASQVRQPIFRTSLQRWRRYEPHLGPLIQALGPYAPAPVSET